MTDVDPDKPASEQFDLEPGDEYEPPTAAEINDLAQRLERTPDRDLSHLADEALAGLVAACKRLEEATEDARKNGYEDELGERVEPDQRVGNLTRREQSRRYVDDDAAAFDAVLDAGRDPREVASINVGDLEDVLGADAGEYLGTYTIEFFERQS